MIYLNQLLSNKILWTAVVSWAVAQLIKLIIQLIRGKKINLAFLVSSGGMPSSHSSFVTAMTVGVGIVEGFDSPLFALSAVLSMIVMYDAAGVRRAAGTHAQAINYIMENIENKGIIIDKKLKELLGHTPIEVAAGALLGIIIGILILG